MTLKQRIQQDMKTAMRERDKARLGTIRLLNAAIKQREVDERIDLNDAAIIAVVDKMIKQRRDSAMQYRQAGREELADAEQAEIVVLEDYLPAAMEESELERLIERAIQDSNATGVRDMGRIMTTLKPQVQGRVDMGEVSRLVKQRLSAI